MFESFNKQFNKPLPGTQIDWSHPLTKGLVAAWLFNNKIDLNIDGVSYSTINYTGDARFHLKYKRSSDPTTENTYGIIGPGFTSKGRLNDSSYLESNIPSTSISFDSFSFAWCGSLNSQRTYGQLLNSSAGWGAGANLTSGANAVWNGTGWASTESGLVLPTNGNRSFYGQSANRYKRIYTIDNKSSIASSDYGSDRQSFNQKIYFGTENYDPSDRGFSGNSEYAYLWFNRFLSAEEHQWLRQNPYDIFKKTLKHFAIFSATDIPENYISPAISGTTQVGQTLTTTTGSWTQFPTSYSYLWKHGDNSSAGGSATGSSYIPVVSDIGYTMKVTVTAINSFGSADATSSQTSTIVPVAPINTSVPTISGPTRVGDVLTGTVGSWDNSPTSYTYLWRRSNGEAVAGTATNLTYSILAADTGHSLILRVTASNAGGSNYADSTATDNIINPYSSTSCNLSQLRFSKPLPGSSINWNHPLTRGLIGCWLFNDPGKIIYNYAGYAPFNLIKVDPSQQLVGKGIIGPGFKTEANKVADSSTPSKPFTISSFSFASCGNWSTSDQYSTLFSHRGASFLASGYRVGGSTLGQTWNGNGWSSSESNLTFTNSRDRAFFATSSSRYNRIYSMNHLSSKITGSDFGGDTCTVDSYITIGSDNYDDNGRSFNSNNEYAYLWFNRFLSAEEQQYIRNNPYCFFVNNKYSNSVSFVGLSLINTRKSSSWKNNDNIESPQKASWNEAATIKSNKSSAWIDCTSLQIREKSNWDLMNSISEILDRKYFAWILYNIINSRNAENWNNLFASSHIGNLTKWNDLLLVKNRNSASWQNYASRVSKTNIDWNLLYSLFSRSSGGWISNLGLNQNKLSTWNLFSLLNNSPKTTWDDFSRQINNQNINWTDFLLIYNQLETGWNDLLQLSIIEKSNWNAFSLLKHNRVLSWNISKTISLLHESRWNFAKLLTVSANSFWDNSSSILNPFKTNWNSYNSINITHKNLWNILSLMRNQQYSNWNVGYNAAARVNCTWNNFKLIVDAQKYLWNNHNNINNLNKYSWDNRVLLKSNKNSSWGIRSIVGQSILIDWLTLSSIISKHGMTWNDLYLIVNWVKNGFNVFKAIGFSKEATWDISSSILRSLSIIENLILSGEITEFLNALLRIEENLNLLIDNEELLEGALEVEEELNLSQEIEEEL